MISCEIPDEIDERNQDDESKRYGRKTLREIVTEVQIHHHTKSCKKYNGSCRYGFPRLPCKKTILAKPIPSINKDQYSNEEEEKRLTEERVKKIEDRGKTIKKAPQSLDQDNFEESLRTGYIKLKLLEEKDNSPVNPEPLQRIIQDVIASHNRLGLKISNEDSLAMMMTDRLENKELKNLKIELTDDEQLQVFCKALIGVSYETYEEALETTKNGKVLFLKQRIKEHWVNNYNPEMLYAWSANMDIQLAFDPYAVTTYIVSYMPPPLCLNVIADCICISWRGILNACNASPQLAVLDLGTRNVGNSSCLVSKK